MALAQDTDAAGRNSGMVARSSASRARSFERPISTLWCTARSSPKIAIVISTNYLPCMNAIPCLELIIHWSLPRNEASTAANLNSDKALSMPCWQSVERRAPSKLQNANVHRIQHPNAYRCLKRVKHLLCLSPSPTRLQPTNSSRHQACQLSTYSKFREMYT